MTIEELDKELLDSFKQEVEKIQTLTPSSIRTLADISSVLLCLWHPAVKHQSSHIDDMQEALKNHPATTNVHAHESTVSKSYLSEERGVNNGHRHNPY